MPKISALSYLISAIGNNLKSYRKSWRLSMSLGFWLKLMCGYVT